MPSRRAPVPKGLSTAALVLGLAAVAALGAVIGILVYKQVDAGEWELPGGDDLIRVKRTLNAVRKPSVPRVIFLQREPVVLTAGIDDSSALRSSVVASSGKERVASPGFSGSARQWSRIVKCVQATFAPFDVSVTDVAPPPDTDHVLVAVGGDARKMLGREGPHVGGLAPFSGSLIPAPVVFVFSQRLRNQRRAVCNTIAMEVAHAYGLDHLYNCKDVMTYLPDCGPKFFRDEDVRCGEHKPRDCPGGEPTQNSFRVLSELLGPRQSAALASP